MKRASIIVLLIASPLAACVTAGPVYYNSPAPAPALPPPTVAEGPQVDPEGFRPALAPYGVWRIAPPYGWVWEPYPGIVGAGWEPYSCGQWEYSDAGWLWISCFSWGWAPFHYGNWVDLYGQWAWVPGSVWGPAWVSWRYGGGYVGWAPLPPPGPIGPPPPSAYVYVPSPAFTSGNVGAHAVTPVGVAGATQPIRSASSGGGHPVSPVGVGPPPAEIALAVGHPIAPAPLERYHAAVLPPRETLGVRLPAGGSYERPIVRRPLLRQEVAAPTGDFRERPPNRPAFRPPEPRPYASPGGYRPPEPERRPGPLPRPPTEELRPAARPPPPKKPHESAPEKAP